MSYGELTPLIQPVSRGGTGLNTLAVNRIPYGNGAAPFQSASNFLFNGTLLTIPGQIQFPATQLASAGANVLDDYEEGAWTPTITFGGASVGITYGANAGQYTKIGRLVVVTGVIVLTSKGTSVGTAFINGLPFTPVNANGYYSAGTGYMGAWAGTVPALIIANFINEAFLRLYAHRDDLDTVVALDNTNFVNTTTLITHAVYMTAS